MAHSIIDSLYADPNSWCEDELLLIHDSGFTIILKMKFAAATSPVSFVFEDDDAAALWEAFTNWQPRKVAALLDGGSL